MRLYGLLTAVLLSVFFFAAPAFAADEGVVGTILEIEGKAAVTPAGGKAYLAAPDATLHMQDTVSTGAGARVFILFIDGTELTLSENAQARIDSYLFDPDAKEGNKAAYSIVGAFQYVSGLIGKSRNPQVLLATPVGVIGIRGTNFWGGMLDGSYNVAVLEGRVALTTEGGEEVIGEGQGTSVQSRAHRPAKSAKLDPARFGRMSATVRLQRRDWVRARIKQMIPRQIELRRRYKEFLTRPRTKSGAATPAPQKLSPALTPKQAREQGQKEFQQSRKERLEMWRKERAARQQEREKALQEQLQRRQQLRQQQQNKP